jgi:hypothetical protein
MMAKQSRKALQQFADNLIKRDLNAAESIADVSLTPAQQFSYERKCREEGYLGTPQQLLEERRASNEALVARLEQAEKNAQANQIDDLRETVEKRHGQLLVELKELRSEITELRSELRETVMARGRPQQGEDEELADSGERDYWGGVIYTKRSRGRE